MRNKKAIAAISMAVLSVTTVVKADVVTEWDQLATNAIVADIPTNIYAVNNPSATVINPSALGPAGSNINPNTASRDLAIESIAVQDAVAPILGGSQPYLSTATPSGPIDAGAAAAQAAYEALNSTVYTQLAGYNSSNPSASTGVAAQQEAIWTSHLNADLAAVSGQTLTNSTAFGHSVTSAIVNNRTGDGSATPTPAGPTNTQYVGAWNGTPISVSTPAAQNGQWIPTPINQLYTSTTGSNLGAAYTTALTGKTVTIDSNGDLALYGSQPWWGGVKPFALTSASQFTPTAPPVEGSPTSGSAFTAAANNVQSLGSLANLTSNDPTTKNDVHIAELWAQDIEVPIEQVTQWVANNSGNTLAQDARLFALVNIATAEARISTWNTKYSNNAIRPITVLNSAYDPNGWQPLLTTPNHPENDSGHSATAAAAFTVLQDLYGNSVPGGPVPVTSYLYDPQTGTAQTDSPVAPIDYSTFSGLISDVGESRVYGGVHFQFSIDAANVVGADIGTYVANNVVAVPEPSAIGLLGIAGLGMLRRRRMGT